MVLQANKKKEDKIKELDALQSEYRSKGGDVVKQREDLYQKKIALTTKINQSKDVLINDAASELPLFMVKNLLLEIEEQSLLEQEKKMLEMTLYQMKYMLKRFEEECPEKSDTASDFIDYISVNAESGNVKEIYRLSDTNIFRLQNMLAAGLEAKVNDTQKHLIHLNRCIKESSQLESYLSVDIDEKAITRIYKRIKTLEQELIELEVEMNTALNNRSTLNGQAITANSEFTKRIEAYLKKVELNDDSDRILKYTRIATDILDEYKIRLQKQKTGVVAETMTQCYKKLANKKNLIDKIIMDPVTLDIIYLSADGDEVPKASLSAGEKQLMVISLLWALAICSKKKLPVIVDTPLSRLDSSHRTTIISTYFPNASDQTIILSTDSEIDRRYYEMMKDDVGDEFTLEYNDDSKSTSIHSGYFVEGMI